MIKKLDKRDDVRLAVVYQREPHARQMAFGEIAQPKDFDERAALAKKTMQELRLKCDVWIDDQGDQSRAMFGDLPHSAIVIDPVGTVRLKLSWCDPNVLDVAIREVPTTVAGKKHTPIERQFFDRITMPTESDKMPTHHRHVMLGYLVTRDLCTNLRNEWLEELRGTGPAQQRRWAKKLLRNAADAGPLLQAPVGGDHDEGRGPPGKRRQDCL